MHTLRLLFLLHLIAVGVPEIATAADAAKPNIVFVLFDDLGCGQPQCYSPQSALRTPHLDKLATEGMRFTDAHTAADVCTPTRYGVLTGRYPSRIGQFGVLTTVSKPGEPFFLYFPLGIPHEPKKKKKSTDAGQSPAERAREMTLAGDDSLD